MLQKDRGLMQVKQSTMQWTDVKKKYEETLPKGQHSCAIVGRVDQRRLGMANSVVGDDSKDM